jgi:peptide/nickel transport system ATP-binding protein
MMMSAHTAARGERGRILLEGRDLLALPDDAMRALRGAQLGMIFQEPMTALSPLMPWVSRSRRCWRCAAPRVPELLGAVHLPDPARQARAHPHMLSG